MADPGEVYRGVTRFFSVIILAFGVVILVVTVAAGGGVLSSGILLGLLFCALGGGRLYLSTRGPS
jgi:hypothetical protein